MSSVTQGIATRIRERREASGMSKAELARKVGVSDVAVNYWEKGVIKQIGHERLLALATTLGVTVSELLGDPMLSVRDEQMRVSGCPRCATEGSPPDSA